MAKREDLVLQTLRDINQKMDRQHESMNDRLVSIEKVQVKQEENLGEHMRRTALLEEDQKGIRSELEPVKKHVAFVEAGLKWMGLIATTVAIVSGIIKIVSALR